MNSPVNLQLKHATIVITGAAGGIGSALVRQFHQAGAKVALHYRSSGAHAEKLAQELDLKREQLFQADLSSESEVSKMFADITAQLGAPSVLIANAGKYNPKNVPLHEMTLAQWRDTLDNNLTSTFLSTREFLKTVMNQKVPHPSIVLIGSTAGIYGEASHADYAAAKSAMTGLLKSLKNELPKYTHQGRINMICPGWTLTSMATQLAKSEEALRRHLQSTALRKIARPEDVAHAAVFLASTRLSGHMTGQAIELSGGMDGRVLYDPSDIRLESFVAPQDES